MIIFIYNNEFNMRYTIFINIIEEIINVINNNVANHVK